MDTWQYCEHFPRTTVFPILKIQLSATYDNPMVYLHLFTNNNIISAIDPEKKHEGIW